MITPEELQRKHETATSSPASLSLSQGFVSNVGHPIAATPLAVPTLLLTNSPLNIRIQGINGAIIGRKQGPYAQFFTQNRYVSGTHAQLKYTPGAGWCISDKNSSNGTKLNERPLQPEIDMSLKNGDIVTIANISLEVSIR